MSTPKVFTVIAVCCCGCDQNEIHILEAKSAEAAAALVASNYTSSHGAKRILAVFKGAHYDARKQATC